MDSIQAEIDAAAERRADLWKQLSEGRDPEKATEVERLNERIGALWNEARAARTRSRFGSPEAIIARARADERLEREYAKVA